MEEEIEEFNVLQEELVTIKSRECRQGKFRSSDGHTYHVESDVAKQYVTFMFVEEEEQPVTNELARRAKKAAKRARQRSVVEEELDEFYMPQEEPETSEQLEAVISAMECTYRGHRQGMKPSTFQSTDGHIFNVERDFANQQVTFMFGEEEPVTNEVAKRTKKAAKRAQ
jgi:hypothetical protein